MARTRIPLSQADENARKMRERLDLSTAEIGLAVRTTNCLEERGIFTVSSTAKQHSRRTAEHHQLWREDTGRSVSSSGTNRLCPPKSAKLA